MFAEMDVITLFLYVLQQLGMMLGFGSQVILMCTYLMSMRDGAVNETENGLARSVFRVMAFSLLIITISGAGITAMHIGSGQMDIIESPVFIFKWLLIAVSIFFAGALYGWRVWNAWLEGFSGANWGALFLLHIFAPATSMLVFAQLYLIWLIGFNVGWAILVYALRPHRASVRVAASEETLDVPPPPAVPTTVVEEPVAPPPPPAPAPIVVEEAPVPAPAPAPIVPPEPPKPVPVAPPPAPKPIVVPAPKAPTTRMPFVPREVERMPEYVVDTSGGYPFPMRQLQPLTVASAAPEPAAPVVEAPASTDTDVPVPGDQGGDPNADGGTQLLALRVMPRSPDDVPKVFIPKYEPPTEAEKAKEKEKKENNP